MSGIYPPFSWPPMRHALYWPNVFKTFSHVVSNCLSLSQAFLVDGWVYCSGMAYNNPDTADCSAALLYLPMDTTPQWFIEQQIRTALPDADWRPFASVPHPVSPVPLVQMPKLWSHSQSNPGDCRGTTKKSLQSLVISRS